MVLSRSVGTLRAFDPVNSIDVLVSGGVRSGSAFGASASGVGRRSSANMDPDAAGGIRRDASFASRQMLGGGLATTVTGGKPVGALVGCVRGLGDAVPVVGEGCGLCIVSATVVVVAALGSAITNIQTSHVWAPASFPILSRFPTRACWART